MNLKTFALLGLPVVLFGCPTEDTDDSDPIDTAPPTDTDTDVVDTDPPTPLPLAVVVDFQATTISLTIANGTGNYKWGFAQTLTEETDGNGWFGEDCYTGQGASTFCHPAGTTGVTLTKVDAIASIVEGSTTLVPTDTPAMTYILLTEDESACWVWGHDNPHYDALGCMTIDSTVNPL